MGLGKKLLTVGMAVAIVATTAALAPATTPSVDPTNRTKLGVYDILKQISMTHVSCDHI